jgi:uncharacterized protein
VSSPRFDSPDPARRPNASSSLPRPRRALLVAISAVVLASACSGDSEDTPAQGRAIGEDRDIVFEHDGVTIHGSLRAPSGDARAPGALIIAGSGPTDRNGNSPTIPGDVGTLRHLAEVLASNDVASLRYDKLGSGATGVAGRREEDLGVDVFVDHARAALQFLAAQPGIDPERLMIIGHSEGGLIAELLAAEPATPVDLVVVAPAPDRILNVITDQIERQLGQAGLPADQTDLLRREVLEAVDAIRAGDEADPTDPNLRMLFRPSVTKFLRETDRHDPVALARQLPSTTRVLLACGLADIQVPCQSLEAMRSALRTRMPGSWTDIQLPGVNHVLKEVGDTPSTGAEYGQPLPYSREFDAALSQWLEEQAVSR